MATVTRGRILRGDLANWDGKTATASRVDATGGTITGLAIGNEVDVLQVYGGGTSRTVGTLAAAVAKLGTANVSLVLAPGTWTIDADLTVPSNLHVKATAGVILDVSSGKTLTFSGLVEVEDPTTWTSGSGTVVVSNGGANGAVYHRTSAERTAGVTPTNYGYPEFNLLRYGADPAGVATSDTAMTNAIAVCGTTGGTILLPKGVYLFANAISLTGKYGIVIQGAGSTTSGAQVATLIKYSGTGTGSFITMNDAAAGCQIRNCQIVHTSASFTGKYITCSNAGGGDPSKNGVSDCTFGTNVGAGVTHLNLDKTIEFTVERCSFQYGNPSVQGQDHAGGSYSNVVKFRDCEWFSNTAVPINDPGQAWTFDGCTFENLVSGAPGAITTNGVTTASNGLIVSGCWFGDATSTAGTWINGYYNGASITGNYFSGNATGSTAISLLAPQGVSIKGNTFDTFLKGIEFQSGSGGGHGTVIEGNFWNTVTTPISGAVNTDAIMVFNPNSPLLTSPNAKQGVFSTDGFEISPNGIVRQWGYVSSITIGTPLTVNFPMTFPNACWSVVATISGASGTANVLFVDMLGTSSFRGVANGAAGTDSFYWQAVGN